MEEILDFLERDDLIWRVEAWSCKPLELPFELEPRDFIKFAEEDLGENGERSLINALSNIKKSIDCRIESLLYIFGVRNKFKNFPGKRDFLLRVGVITPNILSKINKKRNEMEHEFRRQTREEVEDFVDVAKLFLQCTEQFVNKSDVEIRGESEDKGDWPWASVYLNSEKGLFDLRFSNTKDEYKKATISFDDDENYIRLLQLWVGCILHS